MDVFPVDMRYVLWAALTVMEKELADEFPNIKFWIPTVGEELKCFQSAIAQAADLVGPIRVVKYVHRVTGWGVKQSVKTVNTCRGF